MKIVPLLLVGLGLALLPRSGRACGPDFPNSYLGNSVGEITQLPTLSFEAELRRLRPAAPPPPAADASYDAEAAERAEVRVALAETGLKAADLERELAHYDRHHPGRRLPREFQLYADGANAWNAGDPDRAVQSWRKLLALPASARRYRTVWAAYMLGRALYVRAPEEAQADFQLARAAVARGFPDTQRLARASLGWEARSHLVQADYGQALRLYFQQYQAGEPSALPSLQRAIRLAFSGDGPDQAGMGLSAEELAADRTMRTYFVARPCPDLAALAADGEVRGLIAAWFVSMGGPHAMWGARDADFFSAWMAALRGVGDLDPGEAEGWAYAAYQSGQWSEAQALAERAPRYGARAEWVRAMLLLRRGAIDAAADHLAVAARQFPRDYPAQSDDAENGDTPWQRLAGVQGTLALRRDQFAESLRIFLAAGHWADAAFVAERILTLDELVAFVQALPLGEPGAAAPGNGPAPRNPAADLRYLLARRLARAHRFEEARPYYPPELRTAYDAYLAGCRRGYDSSLAPAARADGFWAAAQVIHEQGMALLGTELAPDYAIWDGDFATPDLAAFRYANVEVYDRTPYRTGGRSEALGVLAPSDAELQRAFAQLPPAQRFHYRARAAELAWLAAGLLPNDDDQTALILDSAGRWLARRSPEQANLFYRSLVVRCPHTELGRRAQAAHWFGKESD